MSVNKGMLAVSAASLGVSAAQQQEEALIEEGQQQPQFERILEVDETAEHGEEVVGQNEEA